MRRNNRRKMIVLENEPYEPTLTAIDKMVRGKSILFRTIIRNLANAVFKNSSLVGFSRLTFKLDKGTRQGDLMHVQNRRVCYTNKESTGLHSRPLLAKTNDHTGVNTRLS